jgi:hypothetical protein
MDYKTIAIDMCEGRLPKGTIDTFNDEQIKEFAEVLYNEVAIYKNKSRMEIRSVLSNICVNLIDTVDQDLSIFIVRNLVHDETICSNILILEDWVKFSKKHKSFIVDKTNMVKMLVRFGIPLTRCHEIQIAKDLKLEYIDGR